MSTAATTEAEPTRPPTDLLTVKVDGKAVSVPRTTPDSITSQGVRITMIQPGFGSSGGTASPRLT